MFARSVASSSTIRIRSGIAASERGGEPDPDLRADAGLALDRELTADRAHDVLADGEAEAGAAAAGLRREERRLHLREDLGGHPVTGVAHAHVDERAARSRRDRQRAAAFHRVAGV